MCEEDPQTAPTPSEFRVVIVILVEWTFTVLQPQSHLLTQMLMQGYWLSNCDSLPHSWNVGGLSRHLETKNSPLSHLPSGPWSSIGSGHLTMSKPPASSSHGNATAFTGSKCLLLGENLFGSWKRTSEQGLTYPRWIFSRLISQRGSRSLIKI